MCHNLTSANQKAQKKKSACTLLKNKNKEKKMTKDQIEGTRKDLPKAYLQLD